MILGLVLSIIGIGSIVLSLPFWFCGFAIFGPILFFNGVYKATRAPSRRSMYYPPPYVPAPYYPPLGAPPSPAAPPPPAVGSKKCPTCGSDTRGDAKFCPSCGAPY